jgi:hypothetical protein
VHKKNKKKNLVPNPHFRKIYILHIPYGGRGSLSGGVLAACPLWCRIIVTEEYIE